MNNKNLKLLILIVSLFFPPLLIILTTQFLKANYLIYSSYKLIYLLPIVYGVFIEKKKLIKAITGSFSLKTLRSNIIRISLIGISFAVIQLVAYAFLRKYLLVDNLVDELNKHVSVNAGNIVFVGIYIVAINSLIEEFFWRGFMFSRLKELLNTPVAHVLTGAAFTSYHILFCLNWFSPGVIALVITAMILFTVLMNLVFSRYKDVFSCWLIHAIVNTVQIYVGLSIFKLI